MPGTARSAVLETLAGRIEVLLCAHPVRIAVDGTDAAGKTTLADELGALIEGRGRPVIRASVDGFHRPRTERYRRGVDSPRGYYLDSFDYGALRAALLDPLGPRGDRRYRKALFDFRSDRSIDLPPRTAPPETVLVCDGVFLQRPELASCWELVIFVHADAAEALGRAVRRDAGLFGSAGKARARYEARYLPGQDLYLRAVRPRESADVVVDNTDPDRLRIVPSRAGAGAEDG